MKTLFLLLWAGLVACAVQAQSPRLVVPSGHTNNITAVAFSPDNRHMLTGGGDNLAKLWDLSGREIQTFAGHEFVVNAVAFSPDGSRVLTGSSDGTAKLWDLSGRVLQTFSGHKNGVLAVAFSPDGKSIATGSEDGTARIWDLSGKTIEQYSGHREKPVTALAFAPDGQSVLSGGEDNSAKRWTLNGKLLKAFPCENSVRAVAFSNDGNYILTGSADGKTKLWSTAGQLTRTFEVGSEVRAVAFSPDQKQILTGSSDMLAKLWNLDGNTAPVLLTGHCWGLTSAAFSPDGKYILTGSDDFTAMLWDNTGQHLKTLSSHASTVNTVAWSPDGKYLLAGLQSGGARLWDLMHDDLLPLNPESENGIKAAAFAPDSPFVVLGNADRTAARWSFDGKKLLPGFAQKQGIMAVAVAPDGKSILTGSIDGEAKLWDLSGKELLSLEKHRDAVTSVAFSKDGQMLVTGSLDRTIILWDLSGKALQTIPVRSQVNAVAVSPDGKLVLSGSYEGTAKLWDLSGAEIRSFKNADEVKSVAFSPDGNQILTGSGDGLVKIWKTSGELLHTMTGHTLDVLSVAYSPDGKYALSGSSDGTLRLWEASSGAAKATLVPLDATEWVVTTPDGLFDASAGAMQRMYFVDSLEVVGLEQLKGRYYEPGLLSKLLGFSADPLRSVQGLKLVEMFPLVTAAIDAAGNKLNIDLEERRGGGLGKLSLFVNGKEVAENLNREKRTHLSVDLSDYNDFYFPGKTNELALRAFNADGWLKSEAIRLNYSAPAGVAKSKGTGDNSDLVSLGNGDPSLYIIAVGTADYRGTALDLKYPDLDATAMAHALESAGKALFKNRVHLRLLTSKSASNADLSNRANIEKAFADFEQQAKPMDILVLYFSGHGVAYGAGEEAQFYYLTKDVDTMDLSDKGLRDSYTISSEDFTKWLTQNPARKQVMILDACNSGKIVESMAAIGKKELSSSQVRALDRMKDRTGMFILTGSAANKVSYEASQYGQGLLTYSLLQNMSLLQSKPDPRVDVMTLFQQARDQVPELAKTINGIQKPVLAFPADGGSFDIGIVDNTVTIPVAQVKPVFIRSDFSDAMAPTDGLHLTRALDNYFLEITTKGAQADLVYVDVAEYQNAYSIKGRYTRKPDGTVEVNVWLFKGGELQGETFQVNGRQDNLQQLVENIVDAVSGKI